MKTHQEKRSTNDLFERAITAAVMYRMLSQHSPWSKDCESSETARCVLLELLLHFLQSSPVIAFQLSLVHSYDLDESTYGDGCYPVATLFNHSCAPNVVRIEHNSQVWMIGYRIVQPGEQLFVDYG